MAWTDIFSAGLGIANSAYNLFTNKRDFDYQKALQQQIFEREDTAIQRRMADLQAAGLNPNLAAGSAASAGSVVSRSSTNDVNMGSALDTMQALNSIRMQRQEVENKKVENQILKNQAQKADFEKNVDMYSVLSALGFNVEPRFYSSKNGDYGLELAPRGKDGTIPNMTSDVNTGRTYYNNQLFRNMIIGNQNYNYDLNKLNYDLLKKDFDWYTADKISGMAFNLLGLGTSGAGWRKLFTGGK